MHNYAPCENTFPLVCVICRVCSNVQLAGLLFLPQIHTVFFMRLCQCFSSVDERVLNRSLRAIRYCDPSRKEKNGQMRFHQRGDSADEKHQINPRLTPVGEFVSIVAAVVPVST